MWEDSLTQALATQRPPRPRELRLRRIALLPASSRALSSAGLSESDAQQSRTESGEGRGTGGTR